MYLLWFKIWKLASHFPYSLIGTKKRPQMLVPYIGVSGLQESYIQQLGVALPWIINF